MGAGAAGGRCRESSSSDRSPQPRSQATACYTIPDNGTRQHSQHEEEAPLLDDHHAPSQPRNSMSSSESVVMSPSARALAALHGSPLSVSAQRVEAEVARRTSSIPRSRLQSPSNGLGSQKRATYPGSTARTAELIEAFPQPPAQKVRSRNSAPASMSLFPFIATSGERRAGVSESSQNRREHVSANGSSEQSIIRGVDGARSPSASNVWVSGALPNPGLDGSADTTISRPVRGELVRYRHSGTPVYDRDSASLHDMDQTDDLAMAASLSHPGSPATGKTGATRFFSAASRMVPTPEYPLSSISSPAASGAETQCRDETRAQQARAVANGALRFVSHATSVVTSSGVAGPTNRETIVPVTITSHARTRLHRHASLRSRMSSRYEIDGTHEKSESGDEHLTRSHYCFICQAKRLVDHVSRLPGGKGETRSKSPMKGRRKLSS